MTDAYILYGVLSARNFSSMIPRFRQNTTDCISVYYEMYVNKKKSGAIIVRIKMDVIEHTAT